VVARITARAVSASVASIAVAADHAAGVVAGACSGAGASAHRALTVEDASARAIVVVARVAGVAVDAVVAHVTKALDHSCAGIAGAIRAAWAGPTALVEDTGVGCVSVITGGAGLAVAVGVTRVASALHDAVGGGTSADARTAVASALEIERASASSGVVVARIAGAAELAVVAGGADARDDPSRVVAGSVGAARVGGRTVLVRDAHLEAVTMVARIAGFAVVARVASVTSTRNHTRRVDAGPRARAGVRHTASVENTGASAIVVVARVAFVAERSGVAVITRANHDAACVAAGAVVATGVVRGAALVDDAEALAVHVIARGAAFAILAAEALVTSTGDHTSAVVAGAVSAAGVRTTGHVLDTGPRAVIVGPSRAGVTE